VNENLLIFIFFLIFLSAILLKRYLSNQKRKGIVKLIPFKHIEGIKQFIKGIDVNISFDENYIRIDNIVFPISKIEKLKISSSKQLVDKENSVIGRAVVGGILTGGIGAVVGGMSGINDGSKETRLIHYLTMTFKDGSSAIFSFKNDSDRFNLDGVIGKINRMKIRY